MTEVYVIGDNIISSLGFSSVENVENLKKDISGIEICKDSALSLTDFPASLVSDERLSKEFSLLNSSKQYTRFEQLLILSINDAISSLSINFKSKDTLIVISSTKGNIDLLKKENKKNFHPDRVHLWSAAEEVGSFFNCKNTPVVISNACISGVLAIVTAADLIRDGHYKNVVVVGADVMSDFVVSGFQSFKSLSNQPCRPFDKNRDGLSLGEGAGSIVLSNNPEKESVIVVKGGSSNNDANHISGPSRTGEGLFLAIKQAMASSVLNANDIDLISAHGTATPYNDEMEAIAVGRHNMQNVPINSLKGYWGHTLGAAGIIESVASIHSIKNNFIIPSIGMTELGVTQDLNVVTELLEQRLNNCLKIASGFGGCNAAVIYQKINDE